ncbi:hypothetical protein F4781DRAFT_422109 [Annulohypoxylon bovei var. microspora]|nr:hypothetical protein F4781DRAFT_422109 [Annulohypoxylon bovei var. microspora]
MAQGRERSPRPNVDHSSSDDEPYPIENRVTLQSINQKMTINSAMVSNYATQWGPVEAFRELVQNCDEIVYTAMPAGTHRNTGHSKECLGYIRWSRQNGVGTVDITNRQATLQPWHLDMGSSSKVNDKSQAGMHGEGLKVALLVLMRGPQNHAVRCRSGGFSWTFNFTSQRRLVACPVRMTPKAIDNAHDQAKKEVRISLLPIVAILNEDVQFLIGPHVKGRDENGYPTERTEVTRDEFKNWTRAALFLQNIDDGGIVKTKNGDLITDPRFSGNIYLKGLLLKESKEGRSASITGNVLKYGYNFATGTTNRERESMAGADDESRAILAIWNSALLIKGNLVGRLHRLLNSKKIEYADVQKADSFIQEETRNRIKSFILEESKNKWCYTAQEKSQNPRFDQIVQGLKRSPLEVKESYWAILRDSGFRTADEEEMKQFDAATSISKPDEVFYSELHRLIRGGFEFCPITTDTTVIFVKAGWMGLDSIYSHTQKVFKIHDKWSTKQGALEELNWSRPVRIASILLTVARHLLSDAFSQIPTHLFQPDDQFTPSQRRGQAIAESGRRIQEVMQIQQTIRFEVKDCGSFNRLVVKWNQCPAWTKKCQVTIQFHRESTCSQAREFLDGHKVANMRCCTHIAETSYRVFSSTCFTTTVPFDKESLKVQVKKGQDYFLMMYNPEDLKSLVVFREKENAVATKGSSTKEGDHEREDRNAYVLGDRAVSLDVMIPRDWYHSSGPGGEKAVTGVEKVDSSQSTIPSKRPRS